MNNSAHFNYQDIKVIFSNTTLLNFDQTWESIGVSTDSRSIEPNNLFVALEGDQFDGHEYVFEAFSKQASAVVITEKWHENNKKKLSKFNNPLILVQNTLLALGELATFHRNRFDLNIIAVAGSNGKTTTKDIIHSILSQKYNVLKTEKNYNNRIGVALTMLRLEPEHTHAVVELGTNTQGEINTLVDMLQPTEGIITNIGLEHLQMFEDIDGVELEETLLFGKLMKTGGRCYINNNDERLNKYKKIISNCTTYELQSETTDGDADFSVKVEFDSEFRPLLYIPTSKSSDAEPEVAVIQATGLAYALNAVAAAAVGFGLGLTNKEIAKGLMEYKPAVDKAGYARMVVERYANWHILNDCYNANPSSMELSLDTLQYYSQAEYKIAILGDMGEMGAAATKEHIKVIKYALLLANEVIVIGRNMQQAAYEIITEDTNVKLKIYKNFYEIVTYFCEHDIDIASDIALLVKGSRSMEMESLVQMLKDKCIASQQNQIDSYSMEE